MLEDYLNILKHKLKELDDSISITLYFESSIDYEIKIESKNKMEFTKIRDLIGDEWMCDDKWLSDGYYSMHFDIEKEALNSKMRSHYLKEMIN